jgi:hypothetical protein
MPRSGYHARVGRAQGDRLMSPSSASRLRARIPAYAAFAALATLVTLAGLGGCASAPAPATDPNLPALPAVDQFCLAAERVVTHAGMPMKLVIQPDFNGFVKSKALIEGPTLQQFDWTGAGDAVIGISCKMKNTDHLVQAFGPGSAGPDGSCQDMNRAVYALVSREVKRPVFARVVFDPDELVVNEKEPGMTGPDWLAPFELTSVDPDGALRIHTKGFIVNFLDPRFATLPERFRGVHYCHFIAPDHLRALLEGRARPGEVIGRTVDPMPMPALAPPPP